MKKVILVLLFLVLVGCSPKIDPAPAEEPREDVLQVTESDKDALIESGNLSSYEIINIEKTENEENGFISYEVEIKEEFGYSLYVSFNEVYKPYTVTLMSFAYEGGVDDLDVILGFTDLARTVYSYNIDTASDIFANYSTAIAQNSNENIEVGDYTVTILPGLMSMISLFNE